MRFELRIGWSRLVTFEVGNGTGPLEACVYPYHGTVDPGQAGIGGETPVHGTVTHDHLSKPGAVALARAVLDDIERMAPK